MNQLFFLSLFFVVLLASCQESFLYEKTIRLDQTWSYHDSIRFDVPIRDTTKLYDLYLDIEHDKNYAFQNIYTYFHTQYPSGARNSRMVNIDFSDQTGQWYGKCGNQTCRLSVVLQQNAYFNEMGEHLITIEQFTRREALAGVRALAFKVKDTRKTK